MDSYVRSDSVVSRVIAGETLIVPVRKGVGDLASIYSLNAVGGAIWEALAEPRSQGELVHRLQQEFEVESERAAQDVSVFLTDMQNAGLIHGVAA